MNNDPNEIDGLFNYNRPLNHQKFPGFLMIPFIERVFSKFTHDGDLPFACNFLLKTNSFSPEFWEFVSNKQHNSLSLLEYFFNERANNEFYTWNKKLILKFLGDKSPALTYLLTRSSTAPFNLDHFMSMNEDMTFLMTEFFRSNSFTLMEIEIFSQIIEAGYLPTELEGIVQEKLIKHFQSNFMNGKL